jgi:guanylate kinase
LASVSVKIFSSASVTSKPSGSLYVISGPSGAGKGTLVARLMELVPGAWLSISATTRQPREGEVDGVHYQFLTVNQFEDIIAQDGFIEWANVHSNYYGTPLAPIQEHREQGDTVFLEIDVQGAFQVREKIPDAKLVFIAPPSMEVLEQRLRGRGTDSEEVIVKRLANAAAELEAAERYDHVIVNDDLEKATEDLLKVIQ